MYGGAQRCCSAEKRSRALPDILRERAGFGKILEPFEQGWQMDAEWGENSIRREISESDSLRKRGGRGILRARFIVSLMFIDLLSIVFGFTLTRALFGRG